MEGTLLVFLCQASASYDLQLVKLQDVEWEGGDDGRLTQDFLFVFTWQAEDDVSAGEDATCMGSLNGITAALEGVTSVDALQSEVVGTLDANLHNEEGTSVEFLQIVEHGIGQTVGACSDDQSHHIVHCKCLLEELTQTGGWNHNAATWLLLTSDLRGYIRNPEYYLEANDTEHRAAADLLMMVQGWRRYDFKMMEGKSTFNKQHGIEDQLYIDGKVHISKKKKTVDNVDMVVMLKNQLGDRLMGQTRTDAKGNYAFAAPDCYNDWELVFITAKNKKFENYLVGINRMFTPSPRYIGEDETEQIEAKTPRLSILRDQKDHEGNYTFMDGSISLQQVNVTAKRKMSPSAFWEREDLGRVTASMRYDCEKEVEALLDQGQPIPSLIQFLRERNNKIEGNDNLSGSYAHHNAEYRFSDGGPSYDRCPIFWVVDNNFVAGTSFPSRMAKSPKEDEQDDGTTYYFPSSLDEVKRVYISFSKDTWRRFLRGDDFSGMNTVTIHVYTNVREGVRREKGVRHTYFTGFNVPKTYEEEMMLGIVAHRDFRRTVYWNPNVKTDKHGHAEVVFTPSPNCELLLISAEGINSDGSASVYR